MTERVNLVDAYDNRSVVAKLVSMEERISGAESSIEKTVEDGEKSIVTMVTAGTIQINKLLTGLDDTIAKAEAAASTAETASTKAETAAKSVDEDITAANNAVLDAQGYASTGKLHDGTAVVSASNLAKSCETFADQASRAMSQAQTAASAASAGATNAAGYLDTVKASADAAKTSAYAAAQSAIKADAAAASIDASNLVTLTTEQTVSGLKDFTNTGNILRAASRTTSVSITDVLNSGDLGAINGKYNNLMHRVVGSNVESAYGARALSMMDISQKDSVHRMYSSNPSMYDLLLDSLYSMTYDNISSKRFRSLFTIRSPLGHATVEAFLRPVYDSTSGSVKYYHLEVYSYTVLENTMKAVDASNFKMLFYAHKTYRSITMYLAFGYDGAVIYGTPFSVEAYIAPCETTSVGSNIYASGLRWTTVTRTTIPTDSQYVTAGEISIPITTYTMPEESE